MNVGRSLVFGVLILTFLTVVAVTSVLTQNADKMVKDINAQLVQLSETQKSQLNDLVASQKDMLDAADKVQKNQSENIEKTIVSEFDKLSADMGSKIAGMGEEQAHLIGETIGRQIQLLVDSFVITSRTLSESLGAYKRSCDLAGIVPDRRTLDLILTDVLKTLPHAIAAWNVWGENALDGKDKDYIDAYNAYLTTHKEVPRGLDALALGQQAMDARPTSGITGRYSPWIHRVKTDKGEVIVRDFCQTFLEDSFFLVPYEKGEEYVDPPYEDEGNWVAGLCSPIFVRRSLPNGSEKKEIAGVVGLDINVLSFADLLKETKPLETGYAIFVTPEGFLAGHPDTQYITKNVTEMPSGGNEKTLELLKEGKATFYYDKTFTIKPNEETLKIHIPVRIGNVPVPWSVIVIVEKSKVMEAGIKAANQAKTVHDQMNDLFGQLQKGMRENSTKIETTLTEGGKNMGKLSADNINKVHTDTQNAQRRSFLTAIFSGLIVLVFAGIVGVLFANWVNRSITAKDHWYRQVLDTSPTPISVVDTGHKITLLNQAACKLLHIESEAAAVGLDWGTVWQQAVGTARQSIHSLEQGGEKISQEEFNEITWEIFCDYITDVRGKRTGVSEILQDVSARENILRIAEEIEGVVKQTVIGVDAIASDANTLSVGAQEQTQRLTSMIDEIRQMNEQTKTNVRDAEEANLFTREAATAASSGQTHMTKMVESMQEINKMSTSTQDVIKTIESIAFQTNLLALNAAVEAARAGAHGKGFAVVAEEVRNLASRSAKAAQETASLLASSNRQIQQGVEIADQTSESLNRIAELVSKSTDKVSSIAESSKTQDTAMSVINSGLEQIDVVAKSNLDTAQRTASATEELNQMTLHLSESVKRIKGEEAEHG